MPSNWLSMDDNFPTFTGEESPQKQIAVLCDYLFQMRQGLQYSLRNLTGENFNASALQQLTDDQKNAVLKELQQLISAVNQFSAELSSLSARVTATEKLGARINAAEEAIVSLEEGEELLAGELAATQEAGELLRQEVEVLSKMMQVGADDSAVIGEVGKKLYLVGEIYINGQLHEGGGEAT